MKRIINCSFTTNSPYNWQLTRNALGEWQSVGEPISSNEVLDSFIRYMSKIIYIQVGLSRATLEFQVKVFILILLQSQVKVLQQSQLDLSWSWLDLSWLVLSWRDLSWLDLPWHDMTCPDLTCPDLTCPDMTCPDLTSPDLTSPDLTRGQNLKKIAKPVSEIRPVSKKTDWTRGSCLK